MDLSPGIQVIWPYIEKARGAGEEIQHLKTHTTLTGKRSSAPNTHITATLVPGDPVHFPGLYEHCMHMHNPCHLYTHLKIKY